MSVRAMRGRTLEADVDLHQVFFLADVKNFYWCCLSFPVNKNVHTFVSEIEGLHKLTCIMHSVQPEKRGIFLIQFSSKYLIKFAITFVIIICINLISYHSV
jgi:hypothetical protein